MGLHGTLPHAPYQPCKPCNCQIDPVTSVPLHSVKSPHVPFTRLLYKKMVPQHVAGFPFLLLVVKLFVPWTSFVAIRNLLFKVAATSFKPEIICVKKPSSEHMSQSDERKNYFYTRSYVGANRVSV